MIGLVTYAQFTRALALYFRQEVPVKPLFPWTPNVCKRLGRCEGPKSPRNKKGKTSESSEPFLFHEHIFFEKSVSWAVCIKTFHEISVRTVFVVRFIDFSRIANLFGALHAGKEDRLRIV